MQPIPLCACYAEGLSNVYRQLSPSADHLAHPCCPLHEGMNVAVSYKWMLQLIMSREVSFYVAQANNVHYIQTVY